MTDGRMRWSLAAGGEALELQLGQGPPALRLDAREADELIAELGRLRAAMRPSVAPTVGAYELQAPIMDRWGVGKDAISGDPVLTFRHPGLGWLAFAVTRQAARRAAGMLLRVLELPPPTPGGRPN